MDLPHLNSDLTVINAIKATFKFFSFLFLVIHTILNDIQVAIYFESYKWKEEREWGRGWKEGRPAGQ